MLNIIIDFIEIIFGVLLFINALLLIPQIVKLFKAKHADDVSLITFLGFVAVNIFTVFHGFIVHDIWLILGYSLSVITSSITTYLIIRYRYFTHRRISVNNVGKQDKKDPIFEYLESIAEFIPASFYWYDSDGRFMNLNNRTVKAVGAQCKEDVIGKTVHELYQDKGVADEIQQDIDEVMKTGKSSLVEDKIVDVTNRKFRYFSATRGPLRNKEGELIGVMGVSIETTAEKEAEQLKIEAETNKINSIEQEKFRKIVGQMMHDITSPITSINTIVDKLSRNIPENDRVTLRHAIERIEGISQRLLNRYDNKDESEGDKNLLVSLALLQLMNEKREEHRDAKINFEISIDDNARCCFIRHNAGIFKRMISNLVNNSVEALKNISAGKVLITLSVSKNSAIISVEDNGRGIPKHIQDKFEQGIEVTEGKEDGHGLGLTQVRDAINFGGGRCELYASDKGTQIIIYFPRATIPHWIATEIKLTKDDTVIILDDDESIHGAWDNKFKQILDEIPTLQVKHFTYGKDVVDYINNLSTAEKQDTFLLTDYELLEQGMSGLDVVEQTEMLRAILVTSYATHADIQDSVTQVGIKMLPKELVSTVQIKVDKKIKKASKVIDMVWVEDQKWFVDDLVKNHYSHLKVDVYYDPVSFMEDVLQYPLDTRIILDTYYEASNGTIYKQTGYDLAMELHSMGYTKLILFTGEEPKDPVPEYLQIVRKKDKYGTKNLDKF